MEFRLSDEVSILRLRSVDSVCYDYAASELARLLGRLGVRCAIRDMTAPPDGFSLCLAPRGAGRMPAGPSLAAVRDDGFVLSVRPSAVGIHARTAKGVLNGVYDVAERMGFLFLLPSDEWEWLPPDGRQGVRVACGTVRRNPRFAFRGTYGLGQYDFTEEQWLRFQAKLKFNAAGCVPEGHDALLERLGMRVETGGHGLSALLPRPLFKKRPELFRMFQPEDFNGQRRNDSNLCAANPETRRLIQSSYLKSLKRARHVYAAHAWADDLPGGGWCMCSLCRGLSPSDQYLLAMRHLADAVRAERPDVRVPVIAYHDTILPASAIEAPPETFLLYAPRERCYSHALNDPSCYRNRIYHQALKGWMARFPKGHDAHTFEYYFDQLLFRGMVPFMPGVILDDMRVYETEGIRSHLTIQVCGFGSAPDLNMRVFAEGHWDAALTPRGFIDSIARRIDSRRAAPWRAYLIRRAALFSDAMRFCDYPFDLYLDYRWLPENVLPFGRRAAAAQARASRGLAAAARALSRGIGTRARAAVCRLARREGQRAAFEAAELRVMALQQTAMNQLGLYLSRGDRGALECGLRSLKEAVKALGVARRKALATGMSDRVYYLASFNGYLKGEFERKIRTYAGGQETADRSRPPRTQTALAPRTGASGQCP